MSPTATSSYVHGHCNLTRLFLTASVEATSSHVGYSNRFALHYSFIHQQLLLRSQEEPNCSGETAPILGGVQ